jgi:hypothetical protein
LNATLSCSSSGDTYCAVPTNELALSTGEIINQNNKSHK